MTVLHVALTVLYLALTVLYLALTVFYVPLSTDASFLCHGGDVTVRDRCPLGAGEMHARRLTDRTPESWPVPHQRAVPIAKVLNLRTTT